MEQDLMVPGSTIQPAPLVVEKIEMSHHAAGADINMQIDFRISGALNLHGTEGGLIIIEFPPGFAINPGGEQPLRLEATVDAPAQGSLELVGTWSGASVSIYPMKGYELPAVPCSAEAWFVCGASAAIELRGANEWLAGSRVTGSFTLQMGAREGGMRRGHGRVCKSRRTSNVPSALAMASLFDLANTITMSFPPPSDGSDKICPFARWQLTQKQHRQLITHLCADVTHETQIARSCRRQVLESSFRPTPALQQ